MEVVNVKVKYIRPQYQNLKEWVEDDKNVYIGRGGVVFIEGKRFPQKSIWANPFKVSGDNRAEVIAQYEEYIRKKIREEPDKYDLEALRGKTLGCWCKPDGCHGDVLLKLLRK